MICSRRLYKGNSYEICLPLVSGATLVRFYTRGDVIVEKEPEITGDSMCFSFTEEDLVSLEDGVLRYQVVTDYETTDTNSPYVVTTPGNYTGTTINDLIEDAYQSGYTDGSADCHGEYYDDYLTVEILENGQFNIGRRDNFFYSLDRGQTWIQSNGAINVSSGDTISFKWVMDAVEPGVISYYASPIKNNTIKFNAYGNFLSMVFGDDFKVSDASILNMTTLDGLFEGCTGLIDASNLVLSATQLGHSSYSNMFSGCISLVAAPKLPAMNLGHACYMGMFYGCTSLTQAPELPAMNLEGQCYWNMFENCTSLKTAPDLPATTIGDTCYWFMFKGCSSLNYIKCLSAGGPGVYAREWVDGVAPRGVFVKNPAHRNWTIGINGIPEGWIVVDSGSSEFETVYESGYTNGQDYQKSLLSPITVSENGTYSREDGYSSVAVNVPQTGYTQQDLDNAYASGYTDGYQSGYTMGYNEGENAGYQSGYTDGQETCEDCDDAYDSGYTDGYESGYTDGKHSSLVYVQDLIDEGYANVVTGAGGTYIEILPTTPYSASQVLDLGEVARNEKQLTGTTNNIIVWNQELPNGWTNSNITSLYTNKQLNFSPRGEMLWALGDVDNFEITFSGGGWIASDYPWGSYQSEGVFAPRWNANKQAEYTSKGFLKTPKNLTVNLTGSFSSVSQVMFTQVKSTTALTINQQTGTFSCHDVTGMFEGDSALVSLNITGAFNYGTWRTQHNVFDGCTALTGIPYSTSWSRENANNTIYPHNDGVRGSANCGNMFRNCSSLTYLGPTFNMEAISLSGCVVDNINQEALSGTLFYCPLLSDVHIINLNNNNWNFADSSTFTYIPAMSAASIEYLLNNVEDVTSQGGHSVTFAGTYKDSVSAAAIANAQNKGWNVIWDGDSPTPTGSTAVAITYSIPESNYATNITAGKASSFSNATLDGTTPINLKSTTYTGRYMFADAGTHVIEFTPTGDTIGTREFAYTCVKITDVTLPEGITTIGVECFSGCKMLTGVTLCNSLTTIGAQAFMNCSAMTEFHITSGVTTIDDEALRNCSALTGITIPSSVTTLGEEVFEGCSGLTVMEFESATPPTPGNAYALGDVSYTFPIYVPASSVSAYQTAYPNYASRITTK